MKMIVSPNIQLYNTYERKNTLNAKKSDTFLKDN